MNIIHCSFLEGGVGQGGGKKILPLDLLHYIDKALNVIGITG